MSTFLNFLINILFLSFIPKIYSITRICPDSDPSVPKSIENAKSYTLNSITVNNTLFHPVVVGNQIFLHENILLNTSLFNTKEILFQCPDGYRIPTLEDYRSLLSYLGDKAYSTFINDTTAGFNLSVGTYAITNTKSNNDTYSYNFYSLYCNSSTSDCALVSTDLVLTGGKVIKCIINTLSPKIYMTDDTDKIPYIGESRTFAIENSTLLGTIWRINGGDTYYDNVNTVTMTYEEYGMNRIESWGLNLIDKVVYSCIQIFVESKNNYTLNELNMETDLTTIETDTVTYYQPLLYYNTSNVVVAPRYHGNYYVGFKNTTDNFIHILSYSKDNKLKANYNTLHMGDLIDMIASPIGCTLYVKNLNKTGGTHSVTFNSFLLVYNSNFSLLVKKDIMYNNDANKAYKAKALQIHQYDSKGDVKNGMEYMYNPVNSRLFYGHGRTCLLFSYTNYFNSSIGDLNGDTFVTFDEHLNYTDYGKVFGTSNSLIQDFRETKDYFVTASLSSTLQGINVVFTSKYKKTDFYDNKASSYNQRVTYSKSDIVGTISGNVNGTINGKLGGLLYYENDDTFVLVYSNTNDEVSGRHGIYMTSFNFEDDSSSSDDIDDDKFTNIKNTTILEISKDQDIYQIRAGQIGDNVLILYSLSDGVASSFPGELPQNSTTLYAIVNKNGTINCTGIELGEGHMPSNEGMKNFKDGRLLWASISPENKIIIHKLGTLNNYDDTIDDDDLEVYTLEDYIEDDDEGISKLHWIIIGCIIGFVVIVLIIILVIFCYKNCYLKTGEQKTYIGENPDEQYDKDGGDNADSNNGLDINAVNAAEDDKGNKKKKKKKHKKDKGYDF